MAMLLSSGGPPPPPEALGPDIALSMRQSLGVLRELPVAELVSESPHPLGLNSVIALCALAGSDVQEVSDLSIAWLVYLGLQHKLVKVLSVCKHERLTFELLWLISNIACKDTAIASVLVDAGAVKVLVQRMDSDSISILEQCMWGVGNLLGDSDECCAMFLRMGIVDKFRRVFDRFWDRFSITQRDTLLWAVANAARDSLRGTDLTPVLEFVMYILPSVVLRPQAEVRRRAQLARVDPHVTVYYRASTHTLLTPPPLPRCRARRCPT